MNFADFIAPCPEARFLAEYWSKGPLHIPSDGKSDAARRGLLGWDRLNDLLAQRAHWTPANLKLVMNSRPVATDHYLDAAGRADPAKVHQFLAMGASLVADALEDVDSTIAAAVGMLGRRFVALAGANAYCSFGGVQAFASHCDTHEVFAAQLHGEKSWRIYANRADAPVKVLGGEGAQAIIDQAKGPVLAEVRMRPGDLIYLPRGFYHDATASSDVSLHLTFAVLPMTGVGALQLLVEQAESDPMLRAYLPDAGDAGGLQDHLARLAGRLAETMTSPLFRADLAARQRSRVKTSYRPNLPDRPQLHFYAASGKAAQVVRRPSGAVLSHAGGEVPLGLAAQAAEWALQQRAFSVQQLGAQFAWMTPGELQGLIDLLADAGLIFPYTPQL